MRPNSGRTLSSQRRSSAWQAALDSVVCGRTVVVVAHRLSTVRDASRIVVFRGGAVVEEGRHGDLVAAAGSYAELVADQMGR